MNPILYKAMIEPRILKVPIAYDAKFFRLI